MKKPKLETQQQQQQQESFNIVIPGEWYNAVETITNNPHKNHTPPPVVFICGPKNSGKTTFSRYLINVLLLQRYKRVAFLDTDVGQSEFTPPGCLSLTIINEATPDLKIPCLKTPQRCYFFGDISSKRDPTTYLKCVIALYDHYRNELCLSSKNRSSGGNELPLIINTPGWVKGVGYEILVDMLKHITPTHVVKINVSNLVKDLPVGEFWLDDIDDDVSVHLIEISSACKDFDDRTVLVQKEARRIRELRLINYFKQCFPSDMNITTNKELAHALASHPPYQVPIPRIKVRHLHCQVPNAEVFYSLNATIVGLAVCSGDSQSLPICVGLGIVRSIDVLKNLLYVITPVAPSILARVDLLLQGFIQIPTCLLQVQRFVSPYMSANVVNLPDKVLSNLVEPSR